MKRTLILLAMLLLGVALLAQTFGEIGTGSTSTNLPSYALWNYAWSSAIYPAAGFGGARNITQLAFNRINAGSITLPNQKIYLKETPLVSFADNNYENPTSSGYTLVYDGSITAVNGWTIIDISDFSYSGSNNLIIHWENRSGQSNYSTNWNATDCSAGLVKCNGNDTSFPSSGGWAPYPVALPNIRYYYSSDSPATPVNPQPTMNETSVSLNASLSFSLGTNTTGYQVQAGTSADNLVTIASAQISSPGVYSYTPQEPWQHSTSYFWRVIASNGTSITTGPTWSFSTESVVSVFPYSEGFEGASFPPFGWYRSSDVWSRASYPNSGNYCAKASYYHSSPEILRTPRLILPANPVRVSFYWCDGDETSRIVGHDSTYFEISNDLGQSWTTLAVLSASSYESTYHPVSVDLNSYVNQEVYLRWRDVSDGSLYAYGALVDDLNIELISANAVISIQPASIIFPETGVGVPLQQNISISNLGSTNLSFSGVLANGPFSCSVPAAILPSQTISLPITYLPTSNGNHTGSITFEINGTFSGNNVINLSGSAYAPFGSFFENFDASTSLPLRWKAYEDGTSALTEVQVRNSSFDAYSGTNSVRMYNAGDDIENVNIMLISPALEQLSNNVLSFYAKSSWGSATDTVILGYISNPDDPASFVAVQSINLNADYTHYTHSFAASITARYIAFKHGLGDQQNYGIYLDDIGWEPAGNLPNPATAVYPVNQATSIRLDYIGKKLGSKLQWSSGGGAPTGYRIYFGTSATSFDVMNGTDLGLVDTLSVTQALNYNTTYYWKLVPYNADGDAQNCPVWSFVTMPDPTFTVSASSPYQQGFEGIDIGSIPMGWELDNLDNDHAIWTTIGNSTSSQNSHSGERAMHISFSFMTPHNDWLYSVPLYLNAGTQYNVSFWYKSIDFPGDPCIEKLEVKWGSLPSPESMQHTLFYNDNIVSPISYTPFLGSITPPVDGVYFLGFHCFSDPMQFVLLIDDVSVSAGTSASDDYQTPIVTKLQGAYPNPFSGKTTLKYTLDKAQPVVMNVYNVKGQKVRSLQKANLKAGEHSLEWDGKSDAGSQVASGVYFVKLESESGLHVQKLMLLR